MSLEVIAGCMYSGKSEELIRRLRRCQIAGQRVLVLKSSLDDRYSKEDVATHVGEKLQAHTVRDPQEVREYLEEEASWEVVGLDEVQFMGEKITDILERAAFKGIRVIAAGLDLDSEGEPFGPMGRLLAVADSVTKLTAVCVALVPGVPGGELKRCGKPATRSYRVPGHGGSQVLVGSEGKYEARCRECWAAGTRPR